MNKKKNARDNKSVLTNHRRKKKWTKIIATQTTVQIRTRAIAQTRMLTRMQKILQTAIQTKTQIQTQTTAQTITKNGKGTF